MTIVLDSSKFIGCGYCASICPQKAITIYDVLTTLDEDLCNQCGEYILVCQVGAIREVATA
jgi:Fe-S-cluster-containing hydrogenase component 2